MTEMTKCSAQLPPGIAGREDIIFGNIVEILEFHKKLVDIFLRCSNNIHVYLKMCVTQLDIFCVTILVLRLLCLYLLFMLHRVFMSSAVCS